MTFVDTVNENVQESLIHKAVRQSCLVASGHATYRDKSLLFTSTLPSCGAVSLVDSMLTNHSHIDNWSSSHTLLLLLLSDFHFFLYQ